MALPLIMLSFFVRLCPHGVYSRIQGYNGVKNAAKGCYWDENGHFARQQRHNVTNDTPSLAKDAFCSQWKH
jgi:hypothetical protein